MEPFFEAMAIGLSKNYQVMRKLAAEYGILIIEISRNTIPLENFLDHCHLFVLAHNKDALEQD